MAYDDMTEEATESQPKSAIAKLAGYVAMPNIAPDLEEDFLAALGQQVVDEFETDFDSMTEWLQGYDKGLELAKLVAQPKTFPWPGAANIKFPLIANAAMKFGARAYPEIVRNSEVVSCKTIGKDNADAKHERGKRVSTYMNWQLLVQSEDWDSDMDKLLNMLPVVGQMFKKTYFNPVLGRNVSELVMGNKLIVNQQAQSWERARRRTHWFDLYHNEIVEQQRSGLFVDCDLRADENEEAPDDQIHEILEQHRFMDLDKDGYEEPYVVTVDKASAKVLRIKARFDRAGITVKKGKIVRIEPDEYFTPYGFMPAFDGSLHCIGFGHLLYPLNEAANTLINQLLDAGTLANTQGGFIGNGLKLKSGSMRFQPGEWKRADVGAGKIAENIFPLPVKEASATLFSLLGMIIEAANEIGMISDVLSGDIPNANVPATTVLALIEQGQKAFNAVYKRIWRSLTSELRKLYRLNGQYLDPQEYAEVLDDVEASRLDFEMQSSDIVPVADPAISSQAQRMAQAQAAMGVSGRPGVDESLLTNEFLKAMNHPKADLIAPHVQQQTLKPMLEQAYQAGMAQGVQTAAQEAATRQKDRELELKERELDLKAEKNEADIQKIVTETVAKILEISPAVALALAPVANAIDEQGTGNEANAGAVPVLEGAPGDGAYLPDIGGVEIAEGAEPEGLGPVGSEEPFDPDAGIAGGPEQAGGLLGGTDGAVEPGA